MGGAWIIGWVDEFPSRVPTSDPIPFIYFIRILVYISQDGVIVILMEYMDRGSLAEATAAFPEGVPEAFLAGVAERTLAGLTYLHEEARVLHRDIKPSNLLISSRGEVKIADFGVAGHLNDDPSGCQSWVGTVAYMSPERVKGEAYKENTDVWSLGLSILECAMGRFPYLGKDGGPRGAHEPGGGAGGRGEEESAGDGRKSTGFWDVLDQIVESAPPVLPEGSPYSAEVRDVREKKKCNIS